MARAIERIEKDITELKEAIRAIAQELNLAYVIYIYSRRNKIQYARR